MADSNESGIAITLMSTARQRRKKATSPSSTSTNAISESTARWSIELLM